MTLTPADQSEAVAELAEILRRDDFLYFAMTILIASDLGIAVLEDAEVLQMTADDPDPVRRRNVAHRIIGRILVRWLEETTADDG